MATDIVDALSVSMEDLIGALTLEPEAILE
jgi:hypothetical protein